jgi:site-specific DNA-adenine methylase
MNHVTKVEPFLRWAGGKRKLTPLIQAMLPKDFNFEKNRFFEPFVMSTALGVKRAHLGSPYLAN